MNKQSQKLEFSDFFSDVNKEKRKVRSSSTVSELWNLFESTELYRGTFKEENDGTPLLVPLLRLNLAGDYEKYLLLLARTLKCLRCIQIPSFPLKPLRGE